MNTSLATLKKYKLVLNCLFFPVFGIVLFPISVLSQEVRIRDHPLATDINEPEAPWDPRPQRVRPPPVGNRGAIRIPVRPQIDRPDFKHDRNKLRTGPSTPTRRKITKLPRDHPCVTNQKYDPSTNRMIYVPSRIDYDHQTDLAIAELHRLIDIEKRNGKTEFLSQLIKEARINIKRAKRNALAAGNYYVNGIHIDRFYSTKKFPRSEDFIMKSYIPNG